ERLALYFTDVLLPHQRRRTKQDRGEVVLAHGPGESEKRIDEDAKHDQQLHFRYFTTDLRHEREITQQALRLVCRPHDRNQTRKDQQRTGSEEGRIALQIADKTGIRDTLFTQQQPAHPVLAVEM